MRVFFCHLLGTGNSSALFLQELSLGRVLLFTRCCEEPLPSPKETNQMFGYKDFAAAVHHQCVCVEGWHPWWHMVTRQWEGGIHRMVTDQRSRESWTMVCSSRMRCKSPVFFWCIWHTYFGGNSIVHLEDTCFEEIGFPWAAENDFKPSHCEIAFFEMSACTFEDLEQCVHNRR